MGVLLTISGEEVMLLLDINPDLDEDDDGEEEEEFDRVGHVRLGDVFEDLRLAFEDLLFRLCSFEYFALSLSML